MFLNLTGNIEADLKYQLIGGYKDFFGLFLALVDSEKRKHVIDPVEEVSNVLEYKVFYLLGILTFKNEKAKLLLYENYHIEAFINRKCEEYQKLTEIVVQSKNKENFSETKMISMMKTISKMFEFVYYLIVLDKERILKYKKNQTFNKLLKYIDENRSLLALGPEFDPFTWLLRLFKET